MPMIGVEIRLLKMKCPPSFCLFSLWEDNKTSYCWAPISTEHQMGENGEPLDNPLNYVNYVYQEEKRQVYPALF